MAGQNYTKNPFHVVQKITGCTPDDKKLSYASFLQTACLSHIKKRWVGWLLWIGYWWATFIFARIQGRTHHVSSNTNIRLTVTYL